MVGLILPGTMKYCPYIQYYINSFKKANISYEILSWNKIGLNEDADFVFNYKTADHNMIKKTIGYIKFRNWIIKICKKQKYDKLIVFTLAPALLIEGYLQKKYKGKYVLDVRDDTVLRKYFSKQINSLVNNACNVISSSREFEKWLCRKTTMSHNVDIEMVKAVLEQNMYPIDCKSKEKTIHRIMFAGSLNEWKINLEVLKGLQNRPDVSLIYHTPDSVGKKVLIDYCSEAQVNNANFYGAYKKADIYDIYRDEADWANCIRRESIVNTNALPNKLYDAMIAGVPIIVLSHNKAIVNYVKKYNLGLIFSDEAEFSEKFSEKAADFNYNSFEIGRQKFLNEVYSDCVEFENYIVDWAN